MDLSTILTTLETFGIDKKELLKFVAPAKEIQKDVINLNKYTLALEKAIQLENQEENIDTLLTEIKRITSGIAEKISIINIDEIAEEITG